jgi:hypothetical protein
MYATRAARAAATLAVAATTLFATALIPAPVAGQAASANIRLAHFSPDTPEMDVYVVGFDGAATRVLDGLGYGEVSDYATLPPGNYTFQLRPMGAPPDSTPAVTASADLAAGAAYTFAAMGPNAQLQKALLTDSLAAPPAGQAKVRLIQASSSAGEVDVAIVDGPTLAENRPFASATEYAPIDAGTWTVKVTTGDGRSITRRLPLDAGSVNTLVVLEGNGSGPELTRVVDAVGVDVSGSGTLGARQAVPLGGIGTGGGGTAAVVVEDSSVLGSGVVVPVLGFALVVLVMAAAFAVVASGRRRVAR